MQKINGDLYDMQLCRETEGAQRALKNCVQMFMRAVRSARHKFAFVRKKRNRTLAQKKLTFVRKMLSDRRRWRRRRCRRLERCWRTH